MGAARNHGFVMVQHADEGLDLLYCCKAARQCNLKDCIDLCCCGLIPSLISMKPKYSVSNAQKLDFIGIDLKVVVVEPFENIFKLS